MKRLEDDVVTIKLDLAVVRSNYATKEDLRAVEIRLIKWMIATTVGIIATTVSVGVGSVTLLAFLLNSPASRTPAASPAVVITLSAPPEHGTATSPPQK